MAFRFPAEWEPQSAVLLAWPHSGTDWAERLEQVETTYVALASAISRYATALICVADSALRKRAQNLLESNGADLSAIQFVQVEYDDTWLRDSGPISLVDDQQFKLLDFCFTGWGGKFETSKDDALVSNLIRAKLFRNAGHQRIEFALEGGGIETDGQGTLLTTWECLSKRHPQLTRNEISWQLENALLQKRVLWLDHGFLQGDDTDAHIDTLARFASVNRITYQDCDDPSDIHYQPLKAMAAQLASLRTSDNQPYHLYPLPWAQPIIDDGRRLAASYANFLIINGAVLVPAYEDRADAAAAAMLGNAFPNHTVVQIPCRPLIWQNGSLHCITMQLPAGVLK